MRPCPLRIFPPVSNQVGDELGEAVNIQRADIFDAMHRI